MKRYRLCLLIAFCIGFIQNNILAQCPVTALASTQVIQCGDPVNLNAFGQLTDYKIQTSFNTAPMQPGTGWTTTPSAQYNNPCGAPLDGSTCMWMGNTANVPRVLETNPFDLSPGGVINFEMKYATQGGASPCEGIDLPTEGVYIQYRVGAGAWTTIQYYDPNGGTDPVLTNWKKYTLTIPLAACQPNTSIRWGQLNSSGIDTDHWGLDNVEIVLNNPTFKYDWTHDGLPPDQKSNTPTVYPYADSVYTVILSDGAGNSCQSSVAITVVKPTGTITASPTLICPGASSQLNMQASLIPPIPTTCAISTSGCKGLTKQLSIGTGAVSETGYAMFGKVSTGGVSACVNGNGNTDMSGRTQIIILESELKANWNAGQVYSVSFNATGVTGSPASYSNLAISIGCTSKSAYTAATDFQPVAEVYTPKATTIANGWNEIVLDKPYDWPGTGNLVVEICWRGTIAKTGNVIKTATGANRTLNANTCSDACGTVNALMSVNRPNVRLGVCYRPIPSISYTWSPGANLNLPTISTPTATNIMQTTNYTVTAYDDAQPKCNVIKTIAINVIAAQVAVNPPFSSVCPSTTSSVSLTANASTSGAGNTVVSYTWTPAIGLSSTNTSTTRATPTSSTTYIVKITDSQGCTASSKAEVGYCVVLGQDLNYFKSSLRGQTARVEWSVNNSILSTPMKLERFYKGQSQQLWQGISQQGNNEFIDKQFQAGLNVYRLSWLNKNGVEQFSPLLALNSSFINADQFNISNSGEHILLSWLGIEEVSVDLELFSLDGRMVSKWNSIIFQPETSLALTLDNPLSKGIYIITFKDQNSRVCNKRLVVK